MLSRPVNFFAVYGDVNGSSRLYRCIIYRPITPRACAHGAESVRIYFYPGKETLGEKKDLLLWSGLEPGSDALQTTALATEPMGLWQLWTANLVLILLTAAVSVDYSEMPCIRDIWRKPTDSAGNYKVCLLYSFS